MVYGTRNGGKRSGQSSAGGEAAVNQATQHPPASKGPKVSDVASHAVVDITQEVSQSPAAAQAPAAPAAAKVVHITECVICLDDICKAPFTGRLPKCNHVFCFTCIQNWSKQETTCPLCKLEFTTISKMVGELAAAAAATHGKGSNGATAAAASTLSGAGAGKIARGRKRKAPAAPKEKTVKVKKTTQAEYYNRRTQHAIAHESDFIMHMLMSTFQPGGALGSNRLNLDMIFGNNGPLGVGNMGGIGAEMLDRLAVLGGWDPDPDMSDSSADSSPYAHHPLSPVHDNRGNNNSSISISSSSSSSSRDNPLNGRATGTAGDVGGGAGGGGSRVGRLNSLQRQTESLLQAMRGGEDPPSSSGGGGSLARSGGHGHETHSSSSSSRGRGRAFVDQCGNEHEHWGSPMSPPFRPARAGAGAGAGAGSSSNDPITFLDDDEDDYSAMPTLQSLRPPQPSVRVVRGPTDAVGAPVLDGHAHAHAHAGARGGGGGGLSIPPFYRAVSTPASAAAPAAAATAAVASANQNSATRDTPHNNARSSSF